MDKQRLEEIKAITTALQTQDVHSTSYPYYVLKDKKEEWGFFLTEEMAINFLSRGSHPLNRKNAYVYAKSGYMCNQYSNLHTFIKSGELLRIFEGATPQKSDSGMYYVCPNPNCNKFVQRNEQSHGKIDIPYCKWCGQKFDWGDAE